MCDFCVFHLSLVEAKETERENFICKAGTPEGQPPVNAGAYVTVHNNAHIDKNKQKNRQRVYRVRKQQ